MDDESVKIQIDYLKELTKDIHPTHFFSSEPYGEKVSQYMQVENCQVDPKREKVPISATKIRQNLEANKQFVEPKVYEEIKEQFGNKGEKQC